jgi:hypothetical protein
MDKAVKFEQLMLEYDKLAHKVSQLKAINGGINLSPEVEAEIEKLKKKQEAIEAEAMRMQQGM